MANDSADVTSSEVPRRKSVDDFICQDGHLELDSLSS